jgi:hypothetical protein
MVTKKKKEIKERAQTTNDVTVDKWYRVNCKDDVFYTKDLSDFNSPKDKQFIEFKDCIILGVKSKDSSLFSIDYLKYAVKVGTKRVNIDNINSVVDVLEKDFEEWIYRTELQADVEIEEYKRSEKENRDKQNKEAEIALKNWKDQFHDSIDKLQDAINDDKALEKYQPSKDKITFFSKWFDKKNA